ncbi:MAG: DNA-binding protein [Deltaproteobacteria bacterium]|nr:MAG: DNA-binding protein [Deltaproteobacteria bacterium]
MRIKDTYLIRLPHGADLLEVLTEQCRKRGVRVGFLSVIGAVQEATIGYYDQKDRLYRSRQISGGLEITSCMGNISLKDGTVMVHAHILLSDAGGKTYGGHLMSPTILFAGEALIQELEGEPLERKYDEVTGLFLWRNG